MTLSTSGLGSSMGRKYDDDDEVHLCVVNGIKRTGGLALYQGVHHLEGNKARAHGTLTHLVQPSNRLFLHYVRSRMLN